MQQALKRLAQLLPALQGLQVASGVRDRRRVQRAACWQPQVLQSMATLEPAQQPIDALQPYVRDLVIAAPDRPWLGALVWLDETACREAGGPAQWRPALAQRLAAFNGRAGGSSARVLRLLPLLAPPSSADGEATDKRSINGRRVLETRAADVARLYADPADPATIQARGSA